MAITTSPYGPFLSQVAQSGGYQVVMGDVFLCLLKNTYVPDLANHAVYSDVSAFEIAENTGVTGGYETGGKVIDGRFNMDYNASTKTATLPAAPVTWTALTGTVRYAVIYALAGNALLGLLDFGADRTFAAENLTLTFANGLMTVAAA